MRAGRPARSTPSSSRPGSCTCPGLKVAFPSIPVDARDLLWSSIYDDNPVLFFEHRLLYPIKGEVPEEIEPLGVRQGAHPPGRRGRDRRGDRPARPRGAQGRGGSGGGRDLGRGRGPADAAAARRGRRSSPRFEDDAAASSPTRPCQDGLGRRGCSRRAGAGVRLPGRADRAGRLQVLAAPVRAGHGAVRRAARRGRRWRRSAELSEGTSKCSIRKSARAPAAANRRHAASSVRVRTCPVRTLPASLPGSVFACRTIKGLPRGARSVATEVTLPRLGQGMEVGHDRPVAQGRGR